MGNVNLQSHHDQYRRGIKPISLYISYLHTMIYWQASSHCYNKNMDLIKSRSGIYWQARPVLIAIQSKTTTEISSIALSSW